LVRSLCGAFRGAQFRLSQKRVEAVVWIRDVAGGLDRAVQPGVGGEALRPVPEDRVPAVGHSRRGAYAEAFTDALPPGEGRLHLSGQRGPGDDGQQVGPRPGDHVHDRVTTTAERYPTT